MDIGGQMVSSAYGPGGGGYGAYPPRPMSANEKKYGQVNQTVSGASQTFRQAMGSTSPKAAQSPPQEKGFFDKVKDKFKSIF